MKEDKYRVVGVVKTSPTNPIGYLIIPDTLGDIKKVEKLPARPVLTEKLQELASKGLIVNYTLENNSLKCTEHSETRFPEYNVQGMQIVRNLSIIVLARIEFSGNKTVLYRIYDTNYTLRTVTLEEISKVLNPPTGRVRPLSAENSTLDGKSFVNVKLVTRDGKQGISRIHGELPVHRVEQNKGAVSEKNKRISNAKCMVRALDSFFRLGKNVTITKRNERSYGYYMSEVLIPTFPILRTLPFSSKSEAITVGSLMYYLKHQSSLDVNGSEENIPYSYRYKYSGNIINVYNITRKEQVELDKALDKNRRDTLALNSLRQKLKDGYSVVNKDVLMYLVKEMPYLAKLIAYRNTLITRDSTTSIPVQLQDAELKATKVLTKSNAINTFNSIEKRLAHVVQAISKENSVNKKAETYNTETIEYVGEKGLNHFGVSLDEGLQDKYAHKTIYKRLTTIDYFGNYIDFSNLNVTPKDIKGLIKYYGDVEFLRKLTKGFKNSKKESGGTKDRQSIELTVAVVLYIFNQPLYKALVESQDLPSVGLSQEQIASAGLTSNDSLYYKSGGKFNRGIELEKGKSWSNLRLNQLPVGLSKALLLASESTFK